MKTRRLVVILVIACFVTLCIVGCSHLTKMVNNQPYQDTSVVYGEYLVKNEMTFKENVMLLWEFFFEKAERIPNEPLPQKTVEVQDIYDGKRNGLKAAWLGHSTLLINLDGNIILTDPVFEEKVSIVGPTRFNSNLPLELENLPYVDVIIISHDHYDHLNKYSVVNLSQKTERFIVPLGVGRRMRNWGVAEEKIVELNWWQEVALNSGLTIAATPSRHFSGRGLFDRNKTLWASWVIRTGSKKVFFSGDSGYFAGFKEIGEKYGPFDLTFLECGAYNENWKAVHMFPEETVQAHIDLRGKILQPIHWATFNLSLHPWYEPMERLTNAARQQGVGVSTPIMGRVVNYEKAVVADLWWLPAMQRGKKRTVQPEIAADFN